MSTRCRQRCRACTCKGNWLRTRCAVAVPACACLHPTLLNTHSCDGSWLPSTCTSTYDSVVPALSATRPHRSTTAPHTIISSPTPPRAQGRYVGSRKEGDGCYHFVNGDVYEGEFRDDRMDGAGVYTFRQVTIANI